MTNKAYRVTWSNKQKGFDAYEDAAAFAYEIGFYFTVEINGLRFARPF